MTLVATAMGLACTEAGYQIDRFPVRLDPDAGVPVLWASYGDHPPVRVVVDTAAPVTVLYGESAADRRRIDLTVAGWTDLAIVPRLRFLAAPVLVLPRPADLCLSPRAGCDAGGLLGGDLLSRVAVRLDLTDWRLSFFHDSAADDEWFAEACNAVFHSVMAGGGTFEWGDGEVSYSGTRFVVGACLERTDNESASWYSSGRNALLLLTTGAHPLVLSESAFRRLFPESEQPTLQFDTLLGNIGGAGAVYAHLATESLKRVAFVAQENDKWGPCEELQASILLACGACRTGADLTCPCEYDQERCAAASSVVVDATATSEDFVPVAVIRDTEGFLQGVREEVRPGLADVDGLIGIDILRRFVVDLDYPGGRLIFRHRAEPAPGVTIWPAISSPEAAAHRLNHCLSATCP
ncbi:MAG: hypothetical protein V2A73_18000 [Pseudomonadota bacterium]